MHETLPTHSPLELKSERVQRELAQLAHWTPTQDHQGIELPLSFSNPISMYAYIEAFAKLAGREMLRGGQMVLINRTAALAAGVFQASPALFHAWMRLLETEYAEATGQARGHARFALELAQRLDANAIPTLLLIDHQVEAWLAVAQEALGRGDTGQATLALRIAFLLNDGGTGDPQQFAWLQTLHGLLLGQKGHLATGAKLLAEAGEIARQIDDGHLLGGIQLLHGLMLIELGQHQAAASQLRDGIANSDHSRAPGLVESAREALAMMDESAELAAVGDEPAN